MDHLHLTLLGSPTWLFGGEPLHLPYHKVEALLIYLAASPRRPHQRTALAALLWPDAPVRVARQNVSQALLTLRHVLGEASGSSDLSLFLRADAATIQLLPSAPCTTDLAQVRALLAATHAHRHQAVRTCAPCVERLQQIDALCGGDFLEDYLLPESAAFEAWALTEREAVRQDSIQALDLLIDSAEWREQPGQALAAARRQIALDPLREHSHRTLMRLLTCSGQPATALAHFEALQRMVQRELGAPLEAATLALRERIVAARSYPAALRRYEPPPALLPARSTRVIGRHDDQHAVRQAMCFRAERLITIVGPPGIGKTSLAQTVAAAARFDFAAGVAFVELAPLADAALVPAAIARVLDIAERPGHDLARTLAAALCEQHMLLVLDNFEHVPHAAAVVHTLLRVCPLMTILVTSRAPLALAGEWVYQLRPLAVPPPNASVETIGRAAAVALFVDRVAAIDPDFALVPANAHTVAAICAHCDGVPLAIELVAAHADLFALDILLRHVEHGFAALADGPRDLPERQQTLGHAIRWSFDLLPKADQQVFLCLGVFAGGCTAEALAAVLDERDVHASLARLQRASLVQRSGDTGTPRYGLLQIMRAVARDHLGHMGQLAGVCSRHAAYHARLAAHVPTMHTLVAEYENMHAAIAWSIMHEPPSRTIHLGLGLARVWMHNRSWITGLLWLDALLAQAHAVATRSTERYAHLQAWLEQQYDHAQQHTAAQERRAVQVALALVRQAHGHYHEAQHLLEAALAAPWSDVDRFALLLLADVYARTEQFAQAQRLFAACVDLCRACDDHMSVADALSGLAMIACEQAQLDAATAFSHEALRIYESLDHGYGMARILAVLGSISAATHQPRAAIRQYCRSFTMCYQARDNAGCADVFEALAPLAVALDQPVLAVQTLSAAAALRQADGTHLTPAEHAKLDRVYHWAAARLGQVACSHAWQTAHTAAREHMLALIDRVRQHGEE